MTTAEPAHRSGVGPEDRFDILGALQFANLVDAGLREHHTLLDIGCGCLRGGRFFITYLQAGKYFGWEPNVELLEAGKKHEVGQDMLQARYPTFANWDDFKFTTHWSQHKFDFILAQSIFSHATRAQVQTCFKEVAGAMKPGSKFLFTFWKGEDTNLAEWASHAEYSVETIRDLAEVAGLLLRLRTNWKHPLGQTWVEAS